MRTGIERRETVANFWLKCGTCRARLLLAPKTLLRQKMYANGHQTLTLAWLHRVFLLLVRTPKAFRESLSEGSNSNCDAVLNSLLKPPNPDKACHRTATYGVGAFHPGPRQLPVACFWGPKTQAVSELNTHKSVSKRRRSSLLASFC